MVPDWCAIRAEFPALANWTYLDTATYGQTPVRGVKAIHAHLQHRDELACSDFLAWFDDAAGIRENAARLVGCEAADITFLPTASAAVSLLIGGIEWRPGDRVVALKGEFPNNLYYPALLEGVEFIETEWESFWDAVAPPTRLVVMSAMNYSTGFRPPLEEVSDRLRAQGTLLYLDGTQGVGAFQVNTARLRPAMLAIDAYKWLLTPNGAGFVYVDPEVRQWLRPNCIGWRSHHGWRNVANLHQGAPIFSADAEKYEGGMLPFACLYAMDTVIRMMLEIGPEAIERRVLALAADAVNRLKRMGASIQHEGSPIIAARFPGTDAVALAKTLKQERILASARHGNLRVSVHLYNNASDLDRLEEAVRTAVKLPS
ncbi:MAG: aminotransferase class V-fold PLP-dependent enzyme [Acidobacteria bacterium]|nr:aminotransferase class V-fold PLP-dependent enzyme [Acidobacteriota bacterium]